MTKISLLLLGLFIATFLMAQSEYAKGSYVTIEGISKQGYIKVEKWKDVPSYFIIKSEEDGKHKKVSSDQIKELVIEGVAKFQLLEVEIDDKYVPIRLTRYMKNDKMLVKVLVEGIATLYQAGADNATVFWYSLNNGEINLLKYRKYIAASGAEMEDYSFRSQIQADMKCKSVSMGDILDLKYKMNKLADFFDNYNHNCTSDEPVCYFKGGDTNSAKLSFSATAGTSLLKMTRPADTWEDEAITVDAMGFFLGLDLELSLGRKNNWAFVSQTLFSKIDQTWDISDNYRKIEGRIKYQSFRIPAGIRYKQVLTDNFSVYLDANYGLDLAINSYVAKYAYYENAVYTQRSKIKPASLLFLGAGASYKKFKIGCLYEPKRNILPMSELGRASTDYSAWSVLVSYKLF